MATALATMKEVKKGSKGSRARAERCPRIVPSEIEILDLLAEKPLLSGKQIADVRSSSAARTRRLLAHVQSRGLVMCSVAPGRADVPANRHYYLSDAAISLLARREGMPPGRFARKHWLSASRLATLFNALDHTRGTRQFFVDLIAVSRRRDGEALEMWLDEAAAARRYLWHGEVKLLRPDGYGVYRQRDRALAFYLEWDSGSSSIARYRRKLRAYQECFASAGNRAFPTILVVTVRSRIRQWHRAAFEVSRRFGMALPGSHQESKCFGALPLLVAVKDELEAVGAFGCNWWDTRCQQPTTLETATGLWITT